jgi:tetratricopeptide (TPR) repeat protein
MKTMPMMIALGGLLACAAATAAAPDPAFDAGLLSIQQAWAEVNYAMESGAAREQAFASLEKRAEAFTRQHPARAEALIWEGIIESSYAGERGGLGALGLCKEARGNLEAALKIDPSALEGSAYTSLGALYYKVPGFPIGFGSDRKARELLQEALKANPDGIDSNYFFGEFLYTQGEYQQALQYLDKAAQAAPRPGRQLADRGRRAEIATLAAKVKQKMA